LNFRGTFHENLHNKINIAAYDRLMNVRLIPAALMLLTIVAAPTFLAAHDVNYPAGASIEGTIQTEINTKTAQDGQQFTMVTASGSTIYGHLSEVAAASLTRKAHVKLNFDRIRFPDGTRSPLAATLAGVAQKKQVSYGQAAGQVLGGLIVGNIIGKTLGTNIGGLVGLAGGALLAANTSYNIIIPAGAVARITLDEPLTAGRPQQR
jgi:hypothetical protein